MGITVINEFSISSVAGGEDEAPLATLEHAQTRATIQLTGKVLEAQFKVQANYLLMLTEDTPHEEALHIYLLDDGLAIKDRLEISADYTAGVIRNIKVTGADSVSFSFFEEDDHWSLQVLREPKLMLFKNKYPVKSRNRLFGKSWLILSRTS